MGLSSTQIMAQANSKLQAIEYVAMIEDGKVPTIKFEDTYAFHEIMFEVNFFIKVTESHTNRDFYSGRTYTSHSECKRATKCFTYKVDHGNDYTTLNTWMQGDLVPRIQTLTQPKLQVWEIA